MSRIHVLLAAAAFAVPGVILAAAPPTVRTDATGAAVKRGVDAWTAGDYAAAVAAWRPAANGGDADAQFNLAQAYKLGRSVPVDMREAEGWYRKAAAQGHDQAQVTLGLIMFQNGDRAGAMPWLQKAAERGEPRAQYVYGTALFNGDVVAKDWPRAYAMMTRAAAQGLPQARTSIAQMDQFVPLAQRQQGTALAAAPLAPAPTNAAPSAPRPAVRVPPAPPPVVQTTARATQPMPVPPRPARVLPPPTPKPAARPVAPPAPKPVVIARATPKPPAPVAQPARGGWRVQLGAFGTPAAAQGAWGALAGKGALRGASPAYVKAGAITRLQAGPFASRAAAVAACRAAAGGCFPVAP